MKLSENALKIAEARYFMEGEDWEGLSIRVGDSIAVNEKKQTYWRDRFAEEIFDMYFLPGGRILRNAGKLKQSILNCACLPISDSIEAIGETIKSALIMWSYGAGIGIDFSPLREKGRPLISKGGQSSGMVSFLSAFDSVAATIETGGQRRSGCLAMCKVSHPEIFDFIDAKLTDNKLSYFNLSVAVDNNFLQAVEEDGPWDLVFSGRKVKTVQAVDLWNKILDSAMKSGEPGIINYDNLIKNNSFYFQRISATNLCGELPLPEWGMCCLGSLVLPSFLSGKSTNWKKLEQSIYTIVRFLDNVLDLNYFPIKQSEIVTLDARRLGIGVMGLHDFLMAKEIRYGSDRSIQEVERLYKFIRDTAYRASISLAEEKGAFPKFSANEYRKASFIKKLPAKIRMKIKESGIRNCTLLSAQPTGTTSLIADASSGIEPNYSLVYERKDRVSSRYYIHPLLINFLQGSVDNKPDWLVDSADLEPEDHFEVQSAAQRFICNAASKTINFKEGSTINKLSQITLEYIRDLKGVTLYIENSKAGQVLNRLTLEEARKLIKGGVFSSSLNEKDVQCATGTCEI